MPDSERTFDVSTQGDVPSKSLQPIGSASLVVFGGGKRTTATETLAETALISSGGGGWENQAAIG